MDTKDIIMAVLKYLNDSLDEEMVDFSKVNAESLGISYPKYCRVLTMMIDERLITGLAAVNMMGRAYTEYKAMDPQITFAGIEYMNQNKPSAKAYEIAKEIRDWVPGM